jgi:hypothetical protein
MFSKQNKAKILIFSPQMCTTVNSNENQDFCNDSDFKNLVAEFWPLHLFSALFLSTATEFLSIWHSAQDVNWFCRYSATEMPTFVNNFRKIGDT